jgi:hypothetical protein
MAGAEDAGVVGPNDHFQFQFGFIEIGGLFAEEILCCYGQVFLNRIIILE